MNKLALACVLLAACQQDRRPPDEPPITRSLPAPPRDAAGGDAASPDAAPIDAAPQTPDDAFQAAVLQFEKTKALRLVSWGTLHLDGTKKTFRYAGLIVPTNAKWEPICTGPCSGGYLIEESPKRYWWVATWWTAPVFHMPEQDRTGLPSWDELPDTWIQHDQIHNHGKEYVAFGLRGGKLVVLDDDDYNSRIEPDDEHHVYAHKGVCRGICPPLAKYPFRGIWMEVVGPAATIDALPDPSPM